MWDIAGPWLLPHIFDIFLWFRIRKIALVSDIKQAFLAENDHDYLWMIWFDNVLITKTIMKLLPFTSLVFGPKSSPFVLNGTIQFYLEKFLSDNQRKVVIIKLFRNLYFDDVITSFHSINEGIQFYETSKLCLLKG